MKVKFIAPFGRFYPGDVLDLPDGAVFDHSYLEEVREEPEAPQAPRHEMYSAQGALPEGEPAKEGDK